MTSRTLPTTLALALLASALAPARADEEPRILVELRLPAGAPRDPDGTWRGPPGRVPALELRVTNHGDDPVELEGPVGRGRGWTLGPSAWLRVRRPDGREEVVRPTLPELALGRRTLAPGQTATAWLVPSRYLALFDGGRHELSVGLCARGGEVVSAGITLEVERLPATGLRVELREVVQDEHGETARLEFRNAGPAPLSILLPQDGSEWGLLEPHYALVVRDAAGRLVPLLGRCGNHGADYADDASYVLLQPGDRHELDLRLPFAMGGGRHTVAFHYVLTARPDRARLARPGGDDAPGTPLSPLADRLAIGIASARPVAFEREGLDVAALLAGATPEQALERLCATLASPGTSAEEQRLLLAALERVVLVGTPPAGAVARVRAAALAVAPRDGDAGVLADAMRVLARVADASCVPTFRRVILADRSGEDEARGHAAEGWKLVAPLEARRELIEALASRTGARVEAVSLALGALTDERLHMIPSGPGSWMWPSTQGELDQARARWLSWWAAGGESAPAPAPCPACRRPRGKVAPCPGCEAQ